MGKAPDLGKCTFEVGGHMGFFGTANISENRIAQSLAKDSNSPIDCIWTITVAENYQVYIKFNEPALAFPNDCHLNYLQVRIAFSCKHQSQGFSNHVKSSTIQLFLMDMNFRLEYH